MSVSAVPPSDGSAVTYGYHRPTFTALGQAVLLLVLMLAVPFAFGDERGHIIMVELVLGATLLSVLAFRLLRTEDRIVLVLDQRGLVDRRLGTTPLAWHQLRWMRAHHVTSGDNEPGVELEFDPAGSGMAERERVFISLRGFDIDPDQLVAQIRAFAPAATVAEPRMS